MRIFIEFAKDKILELKYIFRVLAKHIADLMLLWLPYFMLWFGVKYDNSSFIEFCKIYWFILLIPILIHILADSFKYYADVAGTGNICPIPVKRFTESDGEGMVSVDNSRIQEMLLYVADVEDYLERKGYL